MALLRWPPAVQAAVCTWPCYNIIRELNAMDSQMKYCSACGRMEISVRVLMYGQPYNSTTLEGCPPDPKAMNEKVSLKRNFQIKHYFIVSEFSYVQNVCCSC